MERFGGAAAVTRRMRHAVARQRYRISSHANHEMSDDALVAADLEEIILRGQVVRRFTRDPRGPRYEVAGTTVDGRRARLVCRFRSADLLVIITAYAETE